jgi:two-component system OmpR family sensor kinase
MFASLRSRLWLTYLLVVGVVLGTIGLALFLYVLRNPLASRETYLRLRVVSTILVARTRDITNPDLPVIQSLVEQIGRTNELRAVIYDAGGRVLFDSSSGTGQSLPTISWPPDFNRTSNAYRDNQGSTWLYIIRPLHGNGALLLAAPRPTTPMWAFLRDELLRPFVQAGIVALLLGLIMTFWISRWIASPLQRMAQGARAVAAGEYHPIKLEGPTEVRDFGRAFNEMVSRVQSSQQSQRDFVANVSHELKTPLTSIQGFAQAIQDGTADTQESIQQAAKVIYGEASRIHRMVIDLLELARWDAGSIEFERAPVNLVALVSGIAEKFQPIARQEDVTLFTEVQPVPIVMGDGDRLSQVFSNLVDNALKYAPSGGQVTIRMQQVNGQVEIRVADNGPGIPPEDLERIFERFYQVDKSRRAANERNFGLGLTIAREIVQAHGGVIYAENKDGKGSVFVVKIPLI